MPFSKLVSILTGFVRRAMRPRRARQSTRSDSRDKTENHRNAAKIHRDVSCLPILIASALCCIWGIVLLLLTAAMVIPMFSGHGFVIATAVFPFIVWTMAVTYCVSGYLVGRRRRSGAWLGPLGRRVRSATWSEGFVVCRSPGNGV